MDKTKWFFVGSFCFLFCLTLFIYYSTNHFTLPDPDALQPPTSSEAPGALPQVPIVSPVGGENMRSYVEMTESCDPYFVGDCINIRSGPGVEYPSIFKMRNGAVLAVGTTTTTTESGSWYNVIFVHPLLYPKRVADNLYVAANLVRPFEIEEKEDLVPGKRASTTKRIIVDVSEQQLYAYEGDTLFMKEQISTGLEFTPTPKGVFTVFRMTPSRFMQGPIPGVSSQVYDLPGVPWNLYFTKEGAVIHGAYWHDHFGAPWSHGCVNLSPENAKKLYAWAGLGMTVTVNK